MNAPIRPQLNHAGLYVFDLEKMRRFYVEVIGLMVSDAGPGYTFKNEFVFLSADPTKHHQLVLCTGRSPQSPVSTVNQLSFKIASLDELRTLYRRVKALAVKGLRSVSHGNAWSIYFEDPEGNTIEMYLDTPWYVAQPHGDTMDLEAMSNDEIVRWTEAKCRQDPHFAPVADWQAKMRQALGL